MSCSFRLIFLLFVVSGDLHVQRGSRGPRQPITWVPAGRRVVGRRSARLRVCRLRTPAGAPQRQLRARQRSDNLRRRDSLRLRRGLQHFRRSNTQARTVEMETMSKTKGQTFRYRFRNEIKTFWYRSRICHVENRLFRFGPESALLDQIEMISFDGADSGTNSDVLVSFLLDVGWWNVCSFYYLQYSYRGKAHR